MTAVTKFSFANWKADGLQGIVRWTDFLQSPALQNDVVFLQDLRMPSPRRLDATRPQNDHWAELEVRGFSGYLGKGCGILFRPENWTINSLFDEPTYLVLEVMSRATTMLPLDQPVSSIFLVSHHFPSNVDPTTGWEGNANPLSGIPRGSTVIIGADWNMVPDDSRDVTRFVTDETARKPVTRSMLPMVDRMRPFDLVDWYRERYPDGREVSRIASYGGTYATTGRRIDSIWGPAGLTKAIQKVNFFDTTSDHRIVQYMMLTRKDVNFGQGCIRRGPPLWRLHPDVPKDKGFQLGLKRWNEQYQPGEQSDDAEESDDTEESDDADQRCDAEKRLDAFQDRLQQVSLHLGLPVGRRHKAAGSEVEKLRRDMALLDLHDKARRQQHADAKKQLQRSLRFLANTIAAGITGGRHSVYRSSSWALNQGKSYAEAVVPCLKKNREGDVTRDTLEVANVIVDEYYDLWEAPKAVAAASHGSTSSPRASSSSSRATRSTLRAPPATAPTSPAWQYAPTSRKLSEGGDIEVDVTAEDILEGLRAVNKGAAPGPDGLPSTVYSLVESNFVPLLVDLANSLLDGSVLSEDNATFRAMLKYKGDDRDRYEVNNYRPISIPTLARKILGWVLNKRLGRLKNFWSPLQQAYVQSGRKEVSIGVLQMVMSRIRDGREPPALMVMLDQDRAFDRVDHGWLLQTMEHYGFGPRIRNYVKGLLANAHVFFSVNRWQTRPIKLNRGLPQGDPASPSLFLLSLQPLLDAIEANGLGVTLGDGSGPQLKVPYLAFADDFLTLVRSVEQSETLRSLLASFSAGSGAVISEEKTKAVVLSAPHHSDLAAIEAIEAARHWNFDTSPEVTFVGHTIDLRDVGVDPDNEGAGLAEADTPASGFAETLASFERLKHQFKAKGTALWTRVNQANTFFMPRLLPPLILRPLPVNYYHRVLECFESFIWQGDTRWVPQEYLTQPPRVGGLGLNHPETMLVAATGAVIVRWLQREDELGTFFRHCLHEFLQEKMDGRDETAFLMGDDRLKDVEVAQGSFWGNIVWTLAKLGVTTSEDWRQWDLSAGSFGWEACTIAGMTLSVYKARDARAALEARVPVQPRWPTFIGGTHSNWLDMLAYSLPAELPLNNHTRTRLSLFNLCVVRTTERNPGDERPPAHEWEDDSDASSSIDGDDEAGQDGEYDLDHDDAIYSPYYTTVNTLRGFCPAPNCRKRDSPLHGFLLCPEVQDNVIVPCKEILRSWLGVSARRLANDSVGFRRGTHVAAKTMLLCWPSQRHLKPQDKWRMALWRALVIDHIAKLRASAIRRSKNEGSPQPIEWAKNSTPVAAVYKNLVNLVRWRWSQLQGRADDDEKKEFLARWVNDTPLFVKEGDEVKMGEIR